MAEISVQVKIVEPGAIKTDFAGRSFDFTNDERMGEYQGLIGRLFAVLSPKMEGALEPVVVAEVIYKAATDGTPQLRYTAGPDAAQIIANRKAADDGTFMNSMKARMAL